MTNSVNTLTTAIANTSEPGEVRRLATKRRAAIHKAQSEAGEREKRAILAALPELKARKERYMRQGDAWLVAADKRLK